jgi:hypothetical protein
VCVGLRDGDHVDREGWAGVGLGYCCAEVAGGQAGEQRDVVFGAEGWGGGGGEDWERGLAAWPEAGPDSEEGIGGLVVWARSSGSVGRRVVDGGSVGAYD